MLVYAKARVCPLKSKTIPQLELQAAALLAKLIQYVATTLKIPLHDSQLWTDSEIVIHWLRRMPCSLDAFVSHRVALIQDTLPDSPWRHVASSDNPADLASRGSTALNLTESSLWWHGPPWLSLPDTQWPTSGVGSPPRELPGTTLVTLTTNITPEPVWDFWTRYSSFSTIIHTLAWVKRFISNCKCPPSKVLSGSLSSTELSDSRAYLLRRAQADSFSDVLSLIKHKKPLPRKHSLAGMVIYDDNGMIKATGRVRQQSITTPKELIPLSLKSPITRLLVCSSHVDHQHPGVAASLSILGYTYYISGLRNFLKKVSRECATCQRAYAKAMRQVMGFLPHVRTTPAPTFASSGVDFAGPFQLRLGHTRKPVITKGYVCIFICMVTRAIHLELCSSLDTQEFLIAFRKFCNRRGTPTDVYSDNGANFVGAKSELKAIQKLLRTSEHSISHLSSTSELKWHFIPPRTPHFGGLWEAGVRSMKVQLRKLVAPHPLRRDEFDAILTEVEAILNSRPLAALGSTEPDSDLVLTPGHFLIGRPLKAPPTKPASTAKLTHLRRWTLVQRLQQDCWLAWKSCYLQSLQARTRWLNNNSTVKVNDLVYLKDETLSSPRWPLAKVVTTYPGTDGRVRAVDVLYNGRTYKRDIQRLVPLHLEENSSQLPRPAPQDVQD